MKTFVLLGKEIEDRQKYRIFHVERTTNYSVPSSAGEVVFDKRFAEPEKDSDGIIRIPTTYEGVPYKVPLQQLYKTSWMRKFGRKTQLKFVTFVAVVNDIDGDLLERGIITQFTMDTLGYEKGW